MWWFFFLQDEENEDFLSISHAMEEIADDPIDCYWLIKCFVNQFHTKFGDSIPHLVSVTQLLSKKSVFIMDRKTRCIMSLLPSIVTLFSGATASKVDIGHMLYPRA